MRRVVLMLATMVLAILLASGVAQAIIKLPIRAYATRVTDKGAP